MSVACEHCHTNVARAHIQHTKQPVCSVQCAALLVGVPLDRVQQIGPLFEEETGTLQRRVVDMEAQLRALVADTTSKERGVVEARRGLETAQRAYNEASTRYYDVSERPGQGGYLDWTSEWPFQSLLVWQDVMLAALNELQSMVDADEEERASTQRAISQVNAILNSVQTNIAQFKASDSKAGQLRPKAEKYYKDYRAAFAVQHVAKMRLTAAETRLEHAQEALERATTDRRKLERDIPRAKAQLRRLNRDAARDEYPHE